MKLSLPTYSNFRDVTQTLQAQSDLNLQVNTNYPSINISLNHSHWYGHNVELRAGLSFSVVEADFQKPFHLTADTDNCFLLRFTFCLSGKFNLRFEPANEDILIKAGHCYLGALNGEIALASEFMPLQKLILVRVDIDPLLFKFFIGDRFNALPADLRQILVSHGSGCCWQSGSISPAVNVILHQLLNCPYQDTIRQLYLEGKVLELMALQANQFTEATKLVPLTRRLKSDDIERIHHAKQILINNLMEPPSLTDLARQVSINDFKLKQGFRQVFGTTVFGYLHQHRMEQALLMLRSTEMSVTQVAQSIGYANPSQFSAAFKKKFGVLPKTMKAQGM
ncbi:MAG: AraC family transcriptional regulator [Cyanobacteria bacterium P01_F01_bin.116]